MACRPLSKTKRYRLVSVVSHAALAEKASEVEADLEANEGISANEGE